jgi:hypothetical protein
MTTYTALNSKGLISLVGNLPKEIESDLYCAHNKLVNLKGSPKIIRGWFVCSRNNLTSFLYSSKIITLYFCIEKIICLV